MFTLTTQPINIEQIKKDHANPQYGALVSFEGLVRMDKHENNAVTALHYFADEPLCMLEGQKIVDEASQRFLIQHIICIQRIGQVSAKEPAIWIGVWSTHRKDCFAACQYIIENVKERLIIWKKEILNNGTNKWVYGKQTPVVI